MRVRTGAQGLPGIKGSTLANLRPLGWWRAGRSGGTQYKYHPARPWLCSCPLRAEASSAGGMAWLPQPPRSGLTTPSHLFPPGPAQFKTYHRRDGRKGRGFILKRLRIYKRGHFILKRDRNTGDQRRDCGPPQAPARPLHPLPGQEGRLVTGDGGEARKEAEGKRFPQNSHLTLKGGRGGQTHKTENS